MAGLRILLSLILFCSVAGPHRALSQQGSGVASQKGTIKTEAGQKLDELLDRYVMYGFSGAVLVAKDGRIILNRGYGLANKEQGIVNTSETIFPIGSLTKQFTAAAILRLEMQGKLSSADLVSKHLGQFPQDKAGMTLHHLLTHTSGLISDGANAQLPLENRDEYIEAVKRTQLKFAPGEKYSYSNVGYNLLAAVVEKVSGISFEDYLQQQLFQRAGMKMTGFVGKKSWSDKKRMRDSLIALGYEPAAIGSSSATRAERPQPSKWDDRGAGGVLTTTGDLFKWYRALEGTRLLSATAKKKLYTPNLGDYAYGWEIKKTEQGTPIIQHGGDVLGYQSWFAAYPQEKLLIITLINNRMRWRTLLTTTLARAAQGKPYELPPALITMKSAELERYAGAYQLPTGGRIHAWTDEGAFLIGAEGQDAVNLLSRAPEKDMALHNGLNARVDGIISKFRAGDFSDLQQYSGTAKPSAYAADVQQWWETFVRNNGAAKSHTILGTARSRTGHSVTFVRVEFERGVKVLRLLWLSDMMVGHGSGVPRPALSQYLPESPTKFTSFDILTSQMTRVSFELDSEGRVIAMRLPSPTGEIVARKMQ
ncbi:MAG TPA: serine hydrolase domain-containing protein [Pyrinomonadaceae bacterium]|nr:serine hydrolase domain-containing protein [Pyrinomonadaceae bacterium]